MCGTCGCGEDNAVTIGKPGTHHHHDHHGHDPDHHHSHDHGHSGREIKLEQDILMKNNLLAERNRGYFNGKGILAINLVSSPGSGKTTLLEKTIRKLKDSTSMYIIEGDQQTFNDAERIEKAGAPVVQVNTGQGCHLDAHMVTHAVEQLEPQGNSILFIENVGNLVCPSMFDLGEAFRVVIMSVTEGEDKPAKYPNMFQSSQLCIINKTDLLPYLDFDLEAARNYALKVNPDLTFIELSAKTGEGLEHWLDWLESHVG